MSAFPSANSKVLVTGASGFVAVHCCKALLEAGFFVRGTVRSASKGEYLKNLFEGFGFKKFEYVIVKDIAQDGAFDDAVKGVDAVEHVASAVTFTFNDPEDIIKPAVNGTVGLLESIKAHGKSVRRVLVVSSIAAVGLSRPAPYVYTENDWNEEAVQQLKSLGKEAPGVLVYCVSKVLAEQAAWAHVKEHKDELNYTLTTVCPPYVWGPVLQEASTFEQLNGSTTILFDTFKKPMTNEELAERVSGFIDVRDFATVSADLLVADKAHNERLILSADEFSWQDVFDNLSALPNVARGNPGATKGKKWDVRISSEKVEGVLGKPSQELFRPLESTIRDTVQSCLERGFLSAEGFAA